MKLINVYPLRKLEAKHVFKDKNGKRQELSPAETMDDVGTTPRVFDGEDPVVAAYLVPLILDKCAKVNKGDMGILNAALNAKPAAEVTDKGAEVSIPDMEAAISKAVEETAKILQANHEEANVKAAEKTKTDLETAIATSNEESGKALQDAIDEQQVKNDEAIATMKEGHDNAIASMQKATKEALVDLEAKHAKEIKDLKKS